jgi:hypothetical protein
MTSKSQTYIFGLLIIASILFSVSSLAYSYLHLKEPSTGIKKETQMQISRNVQRIPNFVGIVITTTDIQKNSQRVIYRYITDKDVNRVFEEYNKYRSISDEEPLFDLGDDKVNQRIVRLINHETDCSPWNEVISSKYVPEVGNKVVYACGVAVPPSYGGFDGTVTILLTKQPTDEEMLSLITILRDIAFHVSPDIKKLS